MDTLISIDEFKEQLDELGIANRLHDVLALCALAMGCGWKPVRAKGIVLTAPDHTQVVLPTNSNLKMAVFRSRARTIIRHRNTGNAPLAAIVGEIKTRIKLDPDHVRILDKAVAEAFPLKKKAATPAPVKAAPKKAAVPVPAITAGAGGQEAEPAPLTEIEATAVPQPKPVSPHVVSTEPWSAHGKRRQQGSTIYPSAAVTQRNWSDGSKDYVCADPDCDWQHENPRSVASHYTKHVRGQGRKVQAPPDGVDPDWNPVRTRRIKKLRTEIDAAMIAALASGVDADAEWIATWIIDHRPDAERSHSGGSEGAEAEGPLMPEEILERMAALLERHTGRSKTLRDQIAALDSLVGQYQEERDAAVARAAAAENNLHAFRDMLNDLE